MSHKSFQTRAPAVSFFTGGYIVNSTECTIVNGMLYPLINDKDRVAHTTGAWMGMTDFSTAEALASYAENQVLAGQLRVDSQGVIHLGERKVEPLGVFSPSKKTILENGFTSYDWAEFHQL